MSRLLHDRYYAYGPEHAWDLATGDSVRVKDIADDANEPPAPATLLEVLDHGRDGEPRWMVADARGTRWFVAARRAAAAARARGYVPVAADVYPRLGEVLDADLQQRALLLIVPPGTNESAGRVALIRAAARWPRPHVLLTFATPRPFAISGPHNIVREARAAYGPRPARAAIPVTLADDVLRHVARGSRAAEFTSTGRHAAAERLLRDVAGALVRRQAFAPAAQALISLGRLLLERGRAVDAEHAFEEAATHGQSVKDETLSLSARIWQAAARTDAGQLTAAESLCRAALLTGVLAADERARAEATLARVLLWQGRIDEAAQRNLACPGTDHETTAYVMATAVRVALAIGDVFTAGQRARELLDLSGPPEGGPYEGGPYEGGPHEGGPCEGVGDRSRRLARVIALSAHTRVLMATGDLASVEERMRHLQQAAQYARTPLRVSRLRLLLYDMYRRAGRVQDAERELAYLRRVQPAAPPLLRDAIGRCLKGVVHASIARQQRFVERNLAASMVALVQEHEIDRDAIARVMSFAAGSLQTSRIELCSSDGGPATAIMSVGSGIATRIGPRVLEAGIAIGPDVEGAGGELGVPVRLGSRLLGALCVRWPSDRTPPPQAGDVLELAAAVLSPRVESMQTVAREVAVASASIPELVGASAAIEEVRRAVTRAAAAPFAVLIEGESGVGKELVARAIHCLSPRRERRFCDLNCAALPDELLESELFGHARGAFTGAVTERAGLVEEADGGTLFLDEVPDLSPRAQAKLLRVLQQQEVRRVGESFSRKVDVRIVSAVNRDMRSEAAAGRFRQDLLYRLDVIRIRVPPLRERPEDIPLLAHHFWRTVAPRVGTKAALAHSTVTALARYSWPGNVRELQNVMAALAVAAPARGQVRSSLLPSVIVGAPAAASTRLADARMQFERRFIEVALARAGGRRARAARDLGLSRQGLLKMLARLGLVDRSGSDGSSSL
jgi:DNA-binding NtrC family response regulator/tetratricopeptide (TPR) repeat protein